MQVKWLYEQDTCNCMCRINIRGRDVETLQLAIYCFMWAVASYRTHAVYNPTIVNYNEPEAMY